MQQEIPEEFIRRYAQLLSEQDLKKLLEFLFKPLRKSLRVNTLKARVEEVKALLEEKGYRLHPIPWINEGFWVEGEESLGKLVEHAIGLFYIQDASSMVPPLVLQPEPGEIVLDMASAPGGKSIHIAALMRNSGILVMNEPLLHRLKVMVGNIERMGVVNSAITQLRGNAFGWRLPNFFDKVLLDAPCSAEGSTRKEQDFFRKLWNLSFIRRAQNVQRDLITAGIHALKPGGVLVYSTCTMTPEENEEILQHALKTFGGKIEVEEVRLEGLKAYPGVKTFEGREYPDEVKRVVRIWPFLNDSEAFVLFKIRKLEETFPLSVRRGKTPPQERFPGRVIDKSLRKKIAAYFQGIYGGLGDFLSGERLVLSGDYIWWQPEKFLLLKGKVAFNRVGVKVVRLYSSGQFRPTHAFLMAFGKEIKDNLRELSEEEAVRFVKGEDIPDNRNYGGEYVALFYRGFPVGWGRKEGNRLRNRFPSSLVIKG